MTLEAVLSRLQRVKRSGAGWKALCPAHADMDPSLSIRQTDGKTLIHCHAGCSPESVLAALDIEPRDLFKDGEDGRRVTAEYNYCDEKGALLFQVPAKEERLKAPVPIRVPEIHRAKNEFDELPDELPER